MANLAGFSRRYQTYDRPEDLYQDMLRESDLTEEQSAWAQDWVHRMYAADPEHMPKLKVVFAERTPYDDKGMEGSFHFDSEVIDGEARYSPVMYINTKQLSENPMKVFMHESGHFARLMIFPNEAEFLNVYNGLSEDQRQDAFAQYHLKRSDAKFSKLEGSELAEVTKAYEGTATLVKAEEWFAYQWARILAGDTADKSVQSPLQQYLKTHIRPFLENWLSPKETGGNKAAERMALDAEVLRWMGYDPRGFKEGVSFGKYYDERSGLRGDAIGRMTDNQGLNAQEITIDEEKQRLLSKIRIIAQTEGPERAAELADFANKIIGEKMLPTEHSFWTEQEQHRAAEVAAEVMTDEADLKATEKQYEEWAGKTGE